MDITSTAPRNGNGHPHAAAPPAEPFRDAGPASGVYYANAYVTGAAAPALSPMTANHYRRIEDIVHNAFTTRADLFRRAMDPRRDINAECGWPENEPTAEEYQVLFDRHPIANRVVEVLAKECWQVTPLVYEAEDSEKRTEFEAAWDALGKQLHTDVSHYSDEAGSLVWEYLLRADILSGVGHYGILLLGIDDGADLSTPAAGVEEANSTPAPRGTTPSLNGAYRLTTNAKTKGRKLLYARCFPEALATVTTVETNRSSPRLGKPTMYSLVIGDATLAGTMGAAGPGVTANVHWTRVIHIADNRGTNETMGVPRMRPVLNALLDIRKVYGSDAEAYWKNCLIRLLLETMPPPPGTSRLTYDTDSLKDEMEKFVNGLQPFLATTNFSTKTVAPTVVDPSAHINVQLEAICIQLGIPVRIFKGSERGELASSQDDAAWNDRLKARQTSYLTPRVVVPFVDRLIMLGVLPVPKAGYHVAWPDLTSQSDAERADVFAKRMGGMSQYVGGGVEAVIPPREMLTMEAGYTDEEADLILEEAAAAQEESMAQAQEFAEQGLGPDGMPLPPTPEPEPVDPNDPEAVANFIAVWNAKCRDQQGRFATCGGGGGAGAGGAAKSPFADAIGLLSKTKAPPAMRARHKAEGLVAQADRGERLSKKDLRSLTSNLSKMTVDDLRVMAKGRRLAPPGGTKAALVAVLSANLKIDAERGPRKATPSPATSGLTSKLPPPAAAPPATPAVRRNGFLGAIRSLFARNAAADNPASGGGDDDTYARADLIADILLSCVSGNAAMTAALDIRDRHELPSAFMLTANGEFDFEAIENAVCRDARGRFASCGAGGGAGAAKTPKNAAAPKAPPAATAPKPTAPIPAPAVPKPPPAAPPAAAASSAPVDKDRAAARKRGPKAVLAAAKGVNAKFAKPPKITGQDGAQAVKDYTGDEHYKRVNKQLRAGKRIEDIPPPSMATVNELASRPLKKPVITYRGIDDATFAAHFANLGTGSEFTGKGFMSTSLSPYMATTFGTTVLEIRARRGVYVADYSAFKGEHELLQPHGTRYRIVGRQESAEVGGKTVRVLMVEEIDGPTANTLRVRNAAVEDDDDDVPSPTPKTKEPRPDRFCEDDPDAFEVTKPVPADEYDDMEVGRDRRPFDVDGAGTANAFCPTGPGGGKDNSCGAGAAKGGEDIVEDTPLAYTVTFAAAGRQYALTAEREPKNDRWEIEFMDEMDRHSTTGSVGHAAVGVMRAVGAALDRFVERRRPERFEFSAKHEEASRMNLYTKVAGLIGRRHGYTVETSEKPFSTVFTFIRQGDAVRTRNEAMRSFVEEFDDNDLP